MPIPERRTPWRDVVDEAEERSYWRRASAREKGDTLIDLLGLVDAIGRFPEPRTRWPGFPKRAGRRLRSGI